MNVQEAIDVLARFEMAAELRGYVRAYLPVHIPGMHRDRLKAHMRKIVQELEPEPGLYAEASKVLIEDDPEEAAAVWLRKTLGLGVTAVDARAIPHTYQTRMSGDTGLCLACGFTREWHMHVA